MDSVWTYNKVWRFKHPSLYFLTSFVGTSCRVCSSAVWWYGPAGGVRWCGSVPAAEDRGAYPSEPVWGLPDKNGRPAVLHRRWPAVYPGQTHAAGTRREPTAAMQIGDIRWWNCMVQCCVHAIYLAWMWARNWNKPFPTHENRVSADIMPGLLATSWFV